jgi:hypothetical protein
MNQVANLAGIDSTVAQYLVDARIDCHNGVKNTGLRIGIEAKENFLQWH